jgi:hypothetical protein
VINALCRQLIPPRKDGVLGAGDSRLEPEQHTPTCWSRFKEAPTALKPSLVEVEMSTRRGTVYDAVQNDRPSCAATDVGTSITRQRARFMQFLEEVENVWPLNRQESFAGNPSARCASIRKGRITSATLITKKVLRSVWGVSLSDAGEERE